MGWMANSRSRYSQHDGGGGWCCCAISRSLFNIQHHFTSHRRPLLQRSYSDIPESRFPVASSKIYIISYPKPFYPVCTSMYPVNLPIHYSSFSRATTYSSNARAQHHNTTSSPSCITKWLQFSCALPLPPSSCTPSTMLHPYRNSRGTSRTPPLISHFYYEEKFP